MSVTLESLASCFQGLLPAQLFTCSSDGMPNAAYLSHVEFVDAQHVALSFQFFNKSRRNIAENPQALVMVEDPDTGQGWSLRLQFIRSETAGTLFDRMAMRIEAIASYTGLKGVFKLRAADVYRVIAIEPVPEEQGLAGAAAEAAAAETVFTVSRLQQLIERTATADSLDALVDAILAGVEETFGFRYAALLLPTEQEGVLVTMATRGYPPHSVAAEVRFGEGIGGFVAECRRPIRVSGLIRGMLYALAMHARASEPPLVRRTREIPAPALANPDSQIGIPLVARGELVGVLCLESERSYRYHEEDKACVEILGRHLGLAIQHMQWQERLVDTPTPAERPPDQQTSSADDASPASSSAPPSVGGSAAPVPGLPATAARRPRCLVYHATDECVTLDGEYLIRGLPARILWRLLKTRESTGRAEFTNRELRLDKSLNLPAWKDNLESRLILLRRRLEQKSPGLELVSRGRGRFALEVDGAVTLTEQP
jgi:adenylate cyclase